MYNVTYITSVHLSGLKLDYSILCTLKNNLNMR